MATKKTNTEHAITAMMGANLGALFGVSEEELTKAQLLATLGKLGSSVVSEDAITYEGNKFVLPSQFDNNIPGAVKYLNQLNDRLNKENDFYRVFKYRPMDVAHALGVSMKKVFGTTGVGASIETFFGTQNPSYLTIDTGVNETARVITGRTAFSPLDATLDIGGTNDRELGQLGYVRVSAPQRYEAQVEGLFMAIEEELKTGSIYRGKAITGAPEPGFIDTSRVDPDKVIYTAEVMTQLRANIWSLVEHTATQRKMGLPLKRSVLIEGPYGTGKSMAAMLTAQKCIANGWTFIQVRPGDNLETAMKTAQLYAPAVVFFEDIDGVAEKGDPATVSKLLDLFDGIGSKGAEVVAVLTTNHPKRIQKGMLRPGRMDAVIHIGHMDATGYRRLIESLVPTDKLDKDIEWSKVSEAYAGLLPAFAKEVTDRAMRYAIDRTGGDPDVLTTDDFVSAANGIRAQLKLMEDAEEGVRTPTLDAVVVKTVRDAVHGMQVADNDGELDDAPYFYRLRQEQEQLND